MMQLSSTLLISDRLATKVTFPHWDLVSFYAQASSIKHQASGITRCAGLVDWQIGRLATFPTTFHISHLS